MAIFFRIIIKLVRVQLDQNKSMKIKKSSRIEIIVFLTPSPTISVASGRNTIHLITSHSLVTVSDISQSLFGEVLGKNEVDRTGKAEISRLEAPAVGKACYARLYSYSRFKKREPMI